MIEVEMSKDIRSFEPKFLGPFTFRQCIALAISCVYGVPFMIFCTPLELSDRGLVASLLMVPVIACGWLKMDGMHFEIFAIRYAYWAFLTPKNRKNKTENSYRKLLNEVNQKELQEKMKDMTPAQKRAFQKEQERPVDYRNVQCKFYN